MESCDNGGICAETAMLYKKSEVLIRLYTPLRVKEGREEFSCKFAITGKTMNFSGESTGLDSMQALILSIRKIGTYLRVDDEIDQDAVEWEKGVPNFPVFENLV